jgi:hypothetical protein
MYPRLKYRASEIRPGEPQDAHNAGFIFEMVNDPAEEANLGEGWFDSPRAAFDAAAGEGASTDAPAPAQPADDAPAPHEAQAVENPRAEKRRRR